MSQHPQKRGAEPLPSEWSTGTKPTKRTPSKQPSEPLLHSAAGRRYLQAKKKVKIAESTLKLKDAELQHLLAQRKVAELQLQIEKAGQKEYEQIIAANKTDNRNTSPPIKPLSETKKVEFALAEIANMKKLRRLTDDPKNILSFSSKINASIMVLKNVYKTNYLYDVALERVVFDKMTPLQRYEWMRYAAENDNKREPKLLIFGRFIEELADRCAKYSSVTPGEGGRKKAQNTKHNHK